MKSYYFDEDQKYSIGSAAKKAYCVNTNYVTNCSNISYTPLEYDPDTHEPILTGLSLSTNLITLYSNTEVNGNFSCTGIIEATGPSASIVSSTTIFAGETIEAVEQIKTGAYFLLPLGITEPNPPPGFVAIFCDGVGDNMYAKKSGGTKKLICVL